MQLTVQLHLRPNPETAAALTVTMERFNEAANWVAGELFAAKLANKVNAQRLLYRAVRTRFGLSAQMAILCIHRVCEAYSRDKNTLPVFRSRAAVTYDARTMSFKGIDKASLLTLAGRVVVPLVMGQHQLARFGHPKKQADLVRRADGQWFLRVSVVVSDGTPLPVTDCLGVDLGIANIATDNDGTQYSGKPVEAVRRKHNLQRKRLQRKDTIGAKKKLKRISKKEADFRKYQNHCISKKIVRSAKDTLRGIALEDLRGIRERLPVWGREAKGRLSGWGFAQLRDFIDYKARLSGVPVVYVDPRNTSRMCAECGCCDKANRKSQSVFLCVSCGHSAHADANAARNIRARGICKLPPELVRRTS